MTVARRIMIAVVTAIVMMAVTFGGSPASADTLQPDSDALIRVLHAAPALAADTVAINVNDISFGTIRFGAAGRFQRAPAGTQTVTMRATSGVTVADTLRLDPGCQHTVLVAQPEGVRKPTRLLDVPECGIPRIQSSNASIRLINATADNGAVVLGAGTSSTAPFTASARIEVPAGLNTVILKSPTTGETLASATVRLEAGSAYTLAYVGGGEVPLNLTGPFLDGTQPTDPPNPALPVNTGAPSGSRTGMSMTLVVVVGLALAGFGVVKRMRHVRHWAALRFLAVGLGLLAVATSCSPSSSGLGVGAAPPTTARTSGTIRPVPTSAQSTTTLPPAGARPPTRLVGPTDEIDAPIVPLSSSFAPELPAHLNGMDIAWFAGSTRPGDVGVAVLAGHVIYGGIPAVFRRLGDVQRGDTFKVISGSQATTFTVRGVYRWTKGDLPTSIFAPTPEATALLFTCTRLPGVVVGPYTENLVILATA